MGWKNWIITKKIKYIEFNLDVEYKKGVFQMGANSRAKANDDTEGIIKVLSEKKTDKILGVHMLCSGAG